MSFTSENAKELFKEYQQFESRPVSFDELMERLKEFNLKHPKIVESIGDFTDKLIDKINTCIKQLMFHDFMWDLGHDLLSESKCYECRVHVDHYFGLYTKQMFAEKAVKNLKKSGFSASYEDKGSCVDVVVDLAPLFKNEIEN